MMRNVSYDFLHQSGPLYLKEVSEPELLVSVPSQKPYGLKPFYSTFLLTAINKLLGDLSCIAAATGICRTLRITFL